MARKITTIKLPPDIQQWLDDITDEEKYPLNPGKSAIIREALRAYMGVVDLQRGDFKPRRTDAVILTQRDANAAKLSRREKFRRDPNRKR